MMVIDQLGWKLDCRDFDELAHHVVDGLDRWLGPAPQAGRGLFVAG